MTSYFIGAISRSAMLF